MNQIDSQLDGQQFDDLPQGELKDFPRFAYVVDHNERGGLFLAHVEDPHGNTVFEVSNEDQDAGGNVIEVGKAWLVHAGLMRSHFDVTGLLSYLKGQGIAAANATMRLVRE